MDGVDGEYLDPIVAAVVGDNSSVLAMIAETQAAMSEFAASAPTMGQLGPQPGGMAEEAAAGLQAGTAAAMAANAPTPEDFAPLIQAAGDAGRRSGEELGRNLSEAGREAGTELGRSLSEAEIAALGDQEFEAYVNRLRDLAQEAGQAMEANAAAGGAAMEARWTAWAAEVEEAGTEAEDAGREIEDLGNKTEDAGAKAAAANANWMLLGGGFLAITAGPFALSSAVVGVGYEIAKLGGEAQGQLQVVDEAFRSSAAHAAQAYEPAIQNIDQGLVSMVRSVEPQMAEMFTELAGPAEDFFHGLESSVEQGMQAMVPAIAQLGPVISTVSEDVGPLVSGLAGAIGDMSEAFTEAGGNQGLGQLADEVGQILPPVGQLVGEASGGLLPVLTATASVLQTVANVAQDVPGPLIEIGAGGFALYKGITSVEGALTGMGAAIGRVSDWLYGYIGPSSAAEAAIAAEGAAAAETTIETDALAASIEAEAAAAGESVAGSEAAAAGIMSIGTAASEAIIEVASFLLELAPLLAIGYIGFKVGEAIGDGISGGMNSSAPQVQNSAYNLGNAAEAGFTSSLQIASPSRVMAQHGQDVAAGVAQGIDSGAPVANAAAAAMAGAMAQAFTTGVSGGGGGYGPSTGGGGGNTYNITNHVHVEAPLASASASEIVNAILPALQDTNLLNGQSMASHNGIKGGAGR